MKGPTKITRRQFMVGSAGTAVLFAGAEALRNPDTARASCTISLPLPYYKSIDEPVLNPQTVREHAFNHYFQGGCMHGAASGLMQAFKEAFNGHGTGWDLLPYGMYRYGHGGVADWGTLCGTLNGCLAIANLIGIHNLIANDLMGWYATALFPTANCEGFMADTGQTAIPDIDLLARSVSDSPLCHISIGKWCKAAGVSVADKSEQGLRYKDDRCSKVCADTAAKTAELINEVVRRGTLIETFAIPEPYARCVKCHTGLKDPVGKMDCLSCHSPSDVVTIDGWHPINSRK